jgi:hypothetical protein
LGISDAAAQPSAAIASADRHTSVFHLIATLNQVSSALPQGSNSRAGCSISSVGTRASFSMRLSQSTHSLFLDLGATEFSAVLIDYFREHLSLQKATCTRNLVKWGRLEN